MNNWITSYITGHKKNQSRYEIDNYLIQSGYDPQEIEETWQKIEYKPVSPKLPRLVVITDFVFKVAGILYAISLIFLLIIFPKGERTFLTILEALILIGLIAIAFWLRTKRPLIALFMYEPIGLLGWILNFFDNRYVAGCSILLFWIGNVLYLVARSRKRGIKVD